MDWNQSTMYEQRVHFILEVQQRTFSFAESCRRYGISRTAGYTWWTRFLAEGFEGLHDRSHRPHHCPHAVAEPIVEHVVDLRQRYGWGSRKIRKLTAVKFGGAPARRTIDRIFERHDLITKKRRRSGKPGHPGKPLTPMDEPNAVWTVDFKGQFKMRNGRYCYPLTIQDGFSRFLLECRGLYSTSMELAKPVFIKTFREFGLPAVIRSDNGTPFASIGLARLTRLSAWWIRLGIRPETIEPGKPQQNGRHERMHRTLNREATQPPKANLSAQQRHFNDFRRTFNHIRPHEALDDATPHSVYRSALRAYPDVLPPRTPHPLLQKYRDTTVAKRLDGAVEALRSAPIEGPHPYLYLDATFLDARWARKVENVSALVAYAVDPDGHRRLLAITLPSLPT